MPHYLVVEEFDGELDRMVEHEPDCPTEVIYEDLEGQKIRDYTCGVGYWTSNYGFMDLEESLDPQYNTPGKHEIDFYNYVPQSSFEDPEAYVYFVNPQDPSET